jgi:hypothetical protein
MVEKILYYLGAGASAQALPLARSVLGTGAVPRIAGLAYELRQIDIDFVFKELKNEKNQASINSIKERCIKLADKADEFGDVDTYAKYLHLMHPGGSELEDLKKTLSQFFSIKQVLLNAEDKRYLPWLVSIMSNKIFPENVKIISWNYDFQVELASGQIGNLEDVDHSGSSFSYSPSMFYHYPNLDPTFSDFGFLSLIHLNGIAGFSKPSDLDTASIFQKRINRQPDQALSFLGDNNLKPNVHFAWEKGRYHTLLMGHITKLIEHTTIMVVIGYSFPFFNRELDKQIFKHLKDKSPLRKIYYQDPILDGQQLKSQFDLDANFDIVHIQNTSNFYIPFEY